VSKGSMKAVFGVSNPEKIKKKIKIKIKIKIIII
jgi:hypothetical protein